MKQACIFGPVDKRMVVYPLIKVLDLMGKTLVVSDDSNFRRLSNNLGLELTVGRTDFILLPEVAKDMLKVRLSSYDYVLFVTTNELIAGCDKIVYCHSLNRGMCSEDVFIDLKNEEYVEVVITPGVIKDKGVFKVDVSKDTLSYVWECEEEKYFSICKNKALQKVTADLFSDYIGVSKEEFRKLLLRKE